MTSLILFYDVITNRRHPHNLRYAYPRCSQPCTPVNLYPCTSDMHALVSHSRTLDIPRTPDIHTFAPRIFIPSHPGYSYPRTPDIHTVAPRILIPSYPGYPGLAQRALDEALGYAKERKTMGKRLVEVNSKKQNKKKNKKMTTEGA